MLKLTDNLKSWLRQNKGVAEDADDASYTKAVAEGICDGSITPQQVTELTKDPDADKASVLTKTLTSMQDAMAAMANQVATLSKPADQKARPTSNVTTSMIVSADPVTGGEPNIRHITADKQYSTTKTALTFPLKEANGRSHPKANQRVMDIGRYIDEPSELDRAVNGAYGKMMIFGPLIARGIMPKSIITDHDKELIQYAARNMNWIGCIREVGDDELYGGKDVYNRRLTEWEVKQVLDESGASQGLEIVPIVFDDSILTQPLLHSELYPRVEVVNIPRGRRIEGGVVANPTITWADTEATQVPLVTTTAFVGAFDTNIHVVQSAILLGLDFLSDTPIAFGDLLTRNYGEVLLHDLDRVIAVGNGTTEPDGVYNASGSTNVTVDAGSWTTGKLMELMFGVPKEYRTGDRNRICYAANETTYRRIRQIATGVTGDDRFLFGNDVETYTLLGHPFLIQGDFGNAQAVFCNFAHYRMYKRLGLQIKSTTEGQTLVRNNHMLVCARARYGGQLAQPAIGGTPSTGMYVAHTANGQV